MSDLDCLSDSNCLSSNYESIVSTSDFGIPLAKQFCFDTESTSSSPGAIFPSDTVSSDNDAIFISENEVMNPNEAMNPNEPMTPNEAMTPNLDSQSELDKIGIMLVGQCCDKLCVRNVTVNDVLLARNRFSMMNMVEQRKWLATKIVDNSNVLNKANWETKYIVAGKAVCKQSFCEIYGFSPKRLARLRKSVSLCDISIEHGNKGKKRMTIRGDEAKVWMEKYFNLIGDKLPDKKQIHLPSWDRQKDVYKRYKDDMMAKGIPEDQLVVLSTFYRMWRDDFSYVAIPEVNINTL